MAQNIKVDLSTLAKGSSAYLSVNSKRWNSEELQRQKEQGKVFGPYNKDANSETDFDSTQKDNRASAHCAFLNESV
jgi:hypothetical protein